MADDTLLSAAGRIADGEHVDWASITSSLPSDDQRAVADELAVLAHIAAGHRQLHQLLPVAADTPPNLMPDRARWGHLDLLNIVGRGSYGTVYRAWDTRLERLVALKLFHGASHPDSVMQEGRMLARVRHEHVVTVYGADMIDGVAGLWMELVHGDTLDELVKTRGAMSALEAAAMGADVAAALGAVHAAGLLHCDIKAQNVVQESSGRVVLMDLGAGQVVPEAKDSDQLSDVAGTPRYMAPELFQAGATATKATDIYSFGVLLYYLVSGSFPVDGKSLGELKQAHHDRRANTLDSARPGLPPALLDLVSRAIDRDPAGRPASAADVQSALAAIAAPMAAAASTPRSVGWWAAGAAAVGLLAIVIARPLFTPAAPPAPEVRSIAVLPIKNLTGDPSKAYIADGLTEVLISNLARIRSLRVPSFAAVAPLRDSERSPGDTAKKLGVQLLLAGSITQADSRVRFSVHLVDATGAAIWGEEIDRDAPGVLSAQAQIARHVAERLALDGSDVVKSAQSQERLKPLAQDAYLKALALVSGGPTRQLESVRFYREAVEIEPAFAAAWAGLSLAEGIFTEASVDADRSARAKVVKQFAEHAIALDPELSMGYAALASEQFYYEWDFTAAERTFKKALELDPSNAFARQRLAMLFAALGRFDEATRLGREARELEPALPQQSTSLGILYYYQRDFDRAIAEMRHALDLLPGFPVAHFGLGRIYLALGRPAEAVSEFELAVAAERVPTFLVELALAYTVAQRVGDAARVLAEIVDRQKQGQGVNLDRLAYIAIADGRFEDAFKLLEEARQQRMVNMLWIAVDPRVDPIRSDPRFQRLVRQMNLTP